MKIIAIVYMNGLPEEGGVKVPDWTSLDLIREELNDSRTEFIKIGNLICRKTEIMKVYEWAEQDEKPEEAKTESWVHLAG